MCRSSAVMYVTVPYNKVLFYVLFFLTSQSHVDFVISLIWAGIGMKKCLLPLLFLRSQRILSRWPIINICICLQGMNLLWIAPMAYHPHTGFHYSKLLTYLPYDSGNFSNISGMGWVGVFLGASDTSRCCATHIQYPLASESFSRRMRKSSLNYSSPCGINPLCQVLQNIASALVANFIRWYSIVITNVNSIPSV